MRLGLGSRRRRGTTATPGVGVSEVKLPSFPPILGWQTTAGRWRKDASGWVQCPANAERTCRDEAGNLLGLLLEGGETFYSAPWHDAAAHSTADPAYLFKTIASDTIAYAGGHSQPDIHGGTGKCVEITQGATANSVFIANNCVTAVAAGDIVRVELLVSIAATGNAPGTLTLRAAPRSGTPATRVQTLSHDASGNFTGWATAVDPFNFRADYAPVGVKSNGEKYWFVWFEHVATAAGSMAPGVGLPTAIAGRKVVLHDLRILRNPQTAPKAVPVLAMAKTFAADIVTVKAPPASGVLLHRLARCRSRVSDGAISVSDARPGNGRCLMSGPYLPYENRIELVPTSESADTPGILPNVRQDIDFVPWQSPTDFRVPLGPGYYNQRLALGVGQACTDYTVVPSFRADLLMLPHVERYAFSPTYFYGKLTIDDTVVFSRASTIAHQFDQGDLPGNSSLALQALYPTSDISAARCLFVSHPVTHSRARAEAQCDDNPATSQVWMGGQAFQTKNGGTIDLTGSNFWRLGRCIVPCSTATTTTITLRIDDCMFDQYWCDALFTGMGTHTISCNRVLFGRTTAPQSDLWQSRREIEVDIGQGWQTLSAAGVSPGALPMGRRARYAGSWNFASGALVPDSQPGRTCIVRNFIRGGSQRLDKPGFQWNASQARWPDEDRPHATGDVYVIAEDAVPTPARPWVRLTFDLGYWTSSGYVADTLPAMQSSGAHCDAVQINRTGCIVTDISGDDGMLLGDAQGLFLTGLSAMAAGDSDIKSGAFRRWIMVSKQSWALTLDYPKTPGAVVTLTDWLTLPMATRYRYANGTTPALVLGVTGANATLALNNVWMGSRAAVSTTVAASGGTLVGNPAQIAVPQIANFAVTPASGTPTIGAMLAPRWLDAFTGAVRHDIDPLDPEFCFTAQAEATTAIALNTTIKRAQGNHARWARLKGRLQRYHAKPDHIVEVPASSAVGTTLLTGLRSKGWMPLWSGNEKDYFAIEGGALKVARPLTGINACWLLQTSDGRTILVDIQ